MTRLILRSLVRLAIAAALIALAPAVAAAQAAPDAPVDASPTVEGALQDFFEAAPYFPDDPWTYERLLVAERLPSGRTLAVEVELRYQDRRLRLPLKLEQTEAGWRVVWAPTRAYAIALREVATHQAPETGHGAQAWADLQRLPAMPIVVLGEAAHTPFGSENDGAMDTEIGRSEAVRADRLVSEHAQLWVGQFLEEDPAPAGVDYIGHGGSDWYDVTSTIMAPASLGLFRVYLVGQADGQLVALPTIAPVKSARPQGVAPLVIGLYPLDDDRVGVRVGVGGQVQVPDAPCAPEMSLCVADPAALGSSLPAVVKAAAASTEAPVGYVMVAGTAELRAEQMLQHLPAVASALELPVSKIFIGYIRREAP